MSGGYEKRRDCLEAEIAYSAAKNAASAQQACSNDSRSSEQVMVDMIRQDLGVTIDPQAWRMFIRHRFERISPLAHRIHDGKR